MIRKEVTKLGLSIILFSLLLSSSITQSQFAFAFQEPIANLVFKTNGGGVRPDYGLYIAQYLRDVGIEIEVKVEEWSVFVGELLITHDYDLGVVQIEFPSHDPDPLKYFSCDGGNNYCNYYMFPYINQSEITIKTALTMQNDTERYDEFYFWQQLSMDKIVPGLPLFSPRKYVAVWGNTLGYDGRWGVANSLPYMSYDGYHEGQETLEEFNIASYNWENLNPIKNRDKASMFLSSFIHEPLLSISPEGYALPYNIIENWTQIDLNHYNFKVRDNLYWSPSYNVIERNADSTDLDPATTTLMTGLKNNESSNGINQKITAKDVVFTLLSIANPLVSEYSNQYSWIKKIKFNSTEEMVFELEIDGNPATQELEYYAFFLQKMAIPCLPEFFLNSTEEVITFSSSNIPMVGIFEGIEETEQWKNYETSAFSCGKYMIDYFIRSSRTSLVANPNWVQIGVIDGLAATLDIPRVNIRIIPDKVAELAEFKTGKLDWIDTTEWKSEREQMQSDPTFEVQTFIDNHYTLLFFNLQRPFLGGSDNDVFLTEAGKETYTKACAVRKAICYGIDRDEMNQVIHDGEYFIIHNLIPPIFGYYYYNDIIKYNRDLSAAIEWLNAAGYDLNYSNEYNFGSFVFWNFVVPGISIPISFVTYFATKGITSFLLKNLGKKRKVSQN